MFSFTLRRPRVPEWRGWLPALALPLAMFAALLALGGDRGYFYRDDGLHDFETYRYIAIAENISAEHNFRLATHIWQREDGSLKYGLYGRFPIGGYALVKLAILPFGDDLAAKLLAARVLTMLMFCGTATLACLSISRITGSRTVAFAAAALGFSGFYAVYYADAVGILGVIDLFGAALAFHGMTVFVQEGRFRQLAVKVCVGLLLGWRVYALLLPFIALGLGGETVALLRSAVSANEWTRTARSALISLARSRYAALAAVSILFGSALLALNIANGYANRDTLLDAPEVRSLLRRSGLALPPGAGGIAWDDFSKQQSFRMGVMLIPYPLYARAVNWGFPRQDAAPALAVLGAAAAGAALAGAALVRRRRILVAAAVLFGVCWAVPMRYNVVDPVHVFESLPYVGIGLTLFTLALIGARRLMGERAVLAICAAAALAFAASVFYAGQIDRDADKAERSKTEMADATTIREIAGGKRIRVIPMRDAWSRYFLMRIWEFYLAGSYFQETDCSSEDDSGFIVAPYRHESLDLLTPENRFAFLYKDTSPLEICRAELRRLESSEPAARSVFDVYFQDEAITYLKNPCAPADYEAPFFAYAYPVDLNDLPKRHRRGGFHTTHSRIRMTEKDGDEGLGVGSTFDSACIMTIQLPGYPIAAVQTGQWTPGGERLWDLFAAPPLDAEARALYESSYRAMASSGEPAVRAEFDLYLDGGTLSYLKEPCGADDARGRFFLSVHPADVVDLPAERLDIGHDSLNFTFEPPAGAFFNGKCMATRELPDYPISHIETGQFISGEGELWNTRIEIDDGR